MWHSDIGNGWIHPWVGAVIRALAFLTAFVMSASAHAQCIAIGAVGCPEGYSTSAKYSGPGDLIVASAAYMLRGYSAATANAARLVNLRRSSDNSTLDFGLSNGNLDQTSVAAWGGVNASGSGSIAGTTLTFTGGVIGGQVTGVGVSAGTVIVSGASPTWTVNISQTVASTALVVANALFITTLYDQAGVRDATQATAANQPYLALNSCGTNSRPSGVFTDALFLLVPTTTSFAQPWTISSVALQRPGNVTTRWIAVKGSTWAWGFSGANQPSIFAGSLQSVVSGATDSIFHASSGLGNGASSAITVDGSATIVNAGATGISNNFGLGSDTGSQGLIGNIEEVLIYSSNVTASLPALGANQRSYCGF